MPEFHYRNNEITASKDQVTQGPTTRTTEFKVLFQGVASIKLQEETKGHAPSSKQEPRAAQQQTTTSDS